MSTDARAAAPVPPPVAMQVAMQVAVQVELPAPLRLLAGTPAVVTLSLQPADGAMPTQRGLVDALETAFPALRGTVRDPATGQRRAYLRFFAENVDISHHGLDAPLPAGVCSGAAAFLIVGAVSGG